MDMSFRVDTEDEAELLVWRERLTACVHDADEHPRFRTLAEWLVVAMGVPPAPFNGSRGRPEAEHTRRWF
jgi:hypothetical protein